MNKPTLQDTLIKALRHQFIDLNISQTDACKKMKISVARWKRLVSGEEQLTLKEVTELTDKLNTHVEIYTHARCQSGTAMNMEGPTTRDIITD